MVPAEFDSLTNASNRLLGRRQLEENDLHQIAAAFHALINPTYERPARVVSMAKSRRFATQVCMACKAADSGLKWRQSGCDQIHIDERGAASVIREKTARESNLTRSVCPAMI
jgi:Zn ribbon nucleic-acid-binding protein